jgi:hypothetical protein
VKASDGGLTVNGLLRPAGNDGSFPLQTTADAPAGSTTLNFASVAQVVPGLGVQGANIPVNTVVTAVTATGVTLSAAVSADVLAATSVQFVYNWSILNLAQYSVRGESTAKPPFNLDRVMVVPAQFGYRNGQRQTSVSYKNQPLSSRSPASDMSINRQVKPIDAHGSQSAHVRLAARRFARSMTSHGASD